MVALQAFEAERHKPVDKDGRPQPLHRPADAVDKTKVPTVAYIASDGVIVMTRTKNDEKSKPADGARGGKNARYDVEGAEIKNAVLWTNVDQAQEMPSRGWHMRRTVVSFMGHWLAFMPVLWVAMLRLRFDQATKLVVLSDGSHWIRDLFAALPLLVRPIMILDYYQVVMRIREMLRAVCGDGSAEYNRLTEVWCGAIRLGHVAFVIGDLKPLATKHEIAASLLGYFKNHEDRMKYDHYEAQGLDISSAPVESANYHLTGARLKQQGMRWSRKGANEMAVLRADLCNDVWRARTRQLLRLAA